MSSSNSSNGGQSSEKSSKIMIESRTSSKNDFAPSIRVEIYNQTYSIRSDGDGEYIMRLADFVDKRMREISSGTLTVDSLKVAILAALHIADELHRLKSIHESADAQLASRSTECVEMLDRLLKTRPAESAQSENSPELTN